MSRCQDSFSEFHRLGCQLVDDAVYCRRCHCCCYRLQNESRATYILLAHSQYNQLIVARRWKQFVYVVAFLLSFVFDRSTFCSFFLLIHDSFDVYSIKCETVFHSFWLWRVFYLFWFALNSIGMIGVVWRVRVLLEFVDSMKNVQLFSMN